MSNRSDLWQLLRSREGNWVGRDDINFVGGSDASRRIRELRGNAAAAGFVLEERRDAKSRFEFRLVQVASPTETSGVEGLARTQWACVRCGTSPVDMSKTQPSVDERWRLGRCYVCRKPSTFRKVGS